jgi:hypothetical protein
MISFFQFAFAVLVSLSRSLVPSSFFLPPSSFGCAGIRRHATCGAILIVGSWDAQRGVEMDETGISVSSFTCRYFPFVNEKLMSNVGEPRARAVSDKLSREVKIKGEVTGATGIMAFAVANACAVANDVADFGDGSGDLLFDEATVSQERAGWREVDMSLSSDPGVTVAP